MSEAPERIYMDPDIKFPECEKQYGCDVEYIRGDLVEAIVKKLGDSLVTAEAKLAKAVEALDDDRVYGVITHTSLATLAELKGDPDA
jgi:hypothetical protein